MALVSLCWNILLEVRIETAAMERRELGLHKL